MARPFCRGGQPEWPERAARSHVRPGRRGESDSPSRLVLCDRCLLLSSLGSGVSVLVCSWAIDASSAGLTRNIAPGLLPSLWKKRPSLAGECIFVEWIPEFGLGVRRASLTPPRPARDAFSVIKHTGKYLRVFSSSPCLPSAKTDLPSLLSVFDHSGKMSCRSSSGRNTWSSKDFCSQWGLSFSPILLAIRSAAQAAAGTERAASSGLSTGARSWA